MCYNYNYVVAAVTITAAVATTVAYLLYTKRKQFRKVGTVSKLFVYPVKSTRGLDIDEAIIWKHGIGFANSAHAIDRSYMITKPDGGMVTARQEPKMVLIKFQMDPEFLMLTAPHTKTLIMQISDIDPHKSVECRVWGECIKGIDCGDDASKWLKTYFNADYRLVFFPQEASGRDLCMKNKDLHKHNLNFGKAIYHDCAPCNVLSEASIADLNSRLRKKVTVRNFRPSILVSGCSAYEEDNWTNVRIGGVELTRAKFCSRCILTTVDPETGTKSDDGEPLNTLKSYRLCREDHRHIYGSSPLLGVHYGVVKEGSIKVGDDVHVS